MADLESELRSAIRKNFLHLNLSRSWDGKEWVTTYRLDNSTTIHEVADVDPVESLRKALRVGNKTQAPVKPKRSMGDFL